MTTNCEEWIRNPTINPLTNRKIKVNGPTYKKFEKDCDESSSPKSSPKHTSPCEEWTKNPTINPRTNRKIKVNGPTYKVLENDCSGIKIKNSKIEIVSLPSTSIDVSMNMKLEIYANNNKRVESNEYVNSLDLGESPKVSGYFQKYGKVLKYNIDDDVLDFDIFNRIIKYVPNFVFIFKNRMTEPYIKLTNINRNGLFDLCLLQLLMYKYPDNVLLSKNVEMCWLKCDRSVNDLVTINSTRYYKGEAGGRVCLTPASFTIERVESRLVRERKSFLGRLLRYASLEDDILSNSHILKYVNKIREEDHEILTQILLRLVSVNEHKNVHNTFSLPMSIDSDILYFNMSSSIKQSTKTFVKVIDERIKNNIEFDIYNRDDVNLLGFRKKLPFNLLFYPKLDLSPTLIIDPYFIEGPYIVEYNRHKQFASINLVVFSNLVEAYVDPKFFEMFGTVTPVNYEFDNATITNMGNITLYNVKEISIVSKNPNFIFSTRVNYNDYINRCIVFIEASDTIADEIIESSQIDLRLVEEYLNLGNLGNSDNLNLNIRMNGFDHITFPESFAYLRHDLLLYFSNCNITSFHPCLFTSNKLNIDFSFCNLSPNSIRSLIENMDTIPNDQRPRITYDMGELREQQPRISVDKVVQYLFAMANQQSTTRKKLKLANFAFLKGHECETYLSEWLNRLYNDSGTTIVKQLIPHLLEMLLEMSRNEEFMQEACNIMHDATATCGDRVILSILYISLQFKMHVLSDKLDNPREIASFLVRGPFIMTELEKVARSKIKTMRVVDELEVYLGYPIKLRDRLRIPIETKEMLYYSCSSLDDKDLNAAATAVEAKLRDKSHIAQFLSTQPLWTKVIYATNPDIFEDVETLQDNLITETSRILSTFELDSI